MLNKVAKGKAKWLVYIAVEIRSLLHLTESRAHNYMSKLVHLTSNNLSSSHEGTRWKIFKVTSFQDVKIGPRNT